MKISFKKGVKENLETVSLDKKQLDQLMTMQKRYVYQPAPRKRRKIIPQLILPWYQIAGFSVLSLFALVVLLTMTGLLDLDSLLRHAPLNIVNTQTSTQTQHQTVEHNTPIQRSSTIQRIADEVATNHIKMKPLEIETTEITAVQSYFSQLGFSPYNAKPLADNTQIALVGGRYCSIQGAKAAQLRYKGTQGGYVTLFEAAYSATLFKELPNIDQGETPVVTYTKGVKVSMWVEKGIVMVSTEKFR